MTHRYTTFVPARVWETQAETAREHTWQLLEDQARSDGHTGPFQRVEEWYPHTDVDGRRWVLARLQVVAS